MNGYEPSIHRIAFGIAALAMAALTFGLAVVGPATIQSGGGEGRTLAAVTKVVPAATEVAIIPERIDVIDICEPKPSSVQVTTTDPRESS
jgi:hypothetical protein